jgi:GTP diphosphokinase / guanosine-3',5'-bis(diphosphate) 3'-diphosphatase
MTTDIENKILEDNPVIQQGFQELINNYLETKHRKHTEIIIKAFHFANRAHKGVKRQSGEPYIMHPIAVAKIVCNEIGLGSTSISAALLHDVVEDTDYTIEDIENVFGHKIAQIVDGLTKISGGIFGDRASAQAENFKKLLLTMNDDIRVILIKIADRLHNMRTLGSLLPNKQYKIAGETLYIYAPLANRLGLNKIKTELENLSFRYEHPEKYIDIEEKLKAGQSQRDELFANFTNPITESLDKLGYQYEIKARVKSPYSIWKKMETKHIAFEDIFDLMAVRIIFKPKIMEEEENECFDIYVRLSKIYRPHPDRLRDWISHPKANGYQSLHVTLMSNEGKWIEVQIRSERMDEMAEQGFAAHWKYKTGEKSEDELEKWLKTIKEILNDPQPDAIDFLDTIKLNLFASEIFVFTPKGEIKTMPQNATALDFAFSIHTFLGSHCIGAKVNHKLEPLSYKLQSGDQVEILTSRSQRVQPTWVNFVTTAKAQTKILTILKKTQKQEEVVGEAMLNEFMKAEDIHIDQSVIDKLCHLHEVKNREELMQKIGNHTIVLGDNDKNILKERTPSGWKRYIPFLGTPSKNVKETSDIEKNENSDLISIDRHKVLRITDESIQKNYKIADCCRPIPGDDILGYIDDNEQIIIHKRQCPIASKLKSSYGNRIIAATWDTHKILSFPIPLYLRGIDNVGVLNQVTQILSSQLNVNIRKLQIDTKDGIFEAYIWLYVHDVEDIKIIIDSLRQIKEIKEIQRLDD